MTLTRKLNQLKLHIKSASQPRYRGWRRDVKPGAFCLDDINAPHSGLVLALPCLPNLPIGRQNINSPNLAHPVSVGLSASFLTNNRKKRPSTFNGFRMIVISFNNIKFWSLHF